MAQKPVFLFDKYINAKVKMKPRGVTVTSANYDACNKCLYYMDGNTTMEMVVTAAIDTVSFGERKFVSGLSKVKEFGSNNKSGMFYEVVSLPNGVVYIDWYLRDVEIGKKGALGSITSGTVQTLQRADFNLSTEQYTAHDYQSGNVNAVYKRKSENSYLFTYKGKLLKIKSEKQLLKAMPEHTAEIQKFFNENKVDFKYAEDVLNLINFCMGL